MFTINSLDFPSTEDRMEKFYSWVDHASHFASRGVELNARDQNIVAVRTRYDSAEGGVGEAKSGYNPNNVYEDDPLKEWIITHNIVTDSGDKFYAERAVNATITENYLSANNRCELQNPATIPSTAKADTYNEFVTPIIASRKAITATYPLVSDPDTDNLGSGVDVASWDYSWLTTDFDTVSANNIFGGCIHNAGATPISTSDLLTHYAFATSFEKTASDKLKLFHNHMFNGI